MIITKKYIVNGFVQGVGYRYFCKKTASLLQITGYAKNLMNGDVEVLAQGSEKNLIHFKDSLQRGPSRSYVNHISEEPIVDADNYQLFFIK
ncbi:MAG: hypothetical protein A2X64_00830 [Ignavibacteria bacterium GWF2_33_9]|nr:MAG: hypothetical protein A2X64_00830 [Ignavibacteria bacterium GWF2_33_9]